MTNPPVPATPLDVEACVRLANREAAGCEYAAQHNREQAKYEAADDPEYAARARRLADESTAEAAVWRALASALPGMGKDSERLDTLESILRNLDAKTEVFLAGLGTTGTARAFQCEIAPATSEGSMAWRSYQGSALRAAIDAAVASTPTEGDPNHE